MALSTAKYEAIHNKTGSDLAEIKANFDNGQHLSVIDFPAESAILYQIQKMQDELDYLRGIIDANNDKVSMTLGTTGSTALAGDTNIVTIGSSTTISFGDMIEDRGRYSIVMTVVKDFGSGNVSKSTTLTLS